jgi:hypothetical protein
MPVNGKVTGDMRNVPHKAPVIQHGVRSAG